MLPEIDEVTILEDKSTILRPSAQGTQIRSSFRIVGLATGLEPKGISVGAPPFSHNLYGITIRLGLLASP